MSSFLVLALLDFTQPFVLECDTSGEDIGVVLMKNKHPIEFERRNFQPHEIHYSIYEKDMLSIMHALSKFQQYLVGSKLVVKTNHNNLRHFLTQKQLNDRKQKWVSKFQAHDFYIEYNKGNMNVVAYALSRKPTFSSIEVPMGWKVQLSLEYPRNQFACELKDGAIRDDMYKVVDGII